MAGIPSTKPCPDDDDEDGQCRAFSSPLSNDRTINYGSPSVANDNKYGVGNLSLQQEIRNKFAISFACLFS